MSGLSRNAKCPCLSDKKFKHCCEGKIDWDLIQKRGIDPRPYLSIRGKNLAFIDKITELFLLDSSKQIRSLRDYKKAFTASAVRELNEEIVRLWPKNIDIADVLQKSAGSVSGLYIGDYGPDELMGAIIRHSIYATKLLIVDPFIYPLSVRDEYNPILNPEQYRAQTLRNVNIWLELAPWIEAGLVEVIRTPADFDRRLNWESMERQEKKFKESAELAAAAEQSVAELMQRHAADWKFRDLVLSRPDASLIAKLEDIARHEDGISKEDLLTHVRRMRDNDPDFLEPFSIERPSSQLSIVSSGANYDVARITASLTGSYLITDLYVKWREIELDRQGRSSETNAWSPFAKAFHECEFKYLDKVSLPDALSLRKDGRLENFRAFLRRVWKQACEPDSFNKVNGKLLADELQSEVQTANEEWKQIDRELLKQGGAAAAGIAVSAPMIGTGQGQFLAAASLLAGVTTLAASTWQRHRFTDKFPAAFFLRLPNRR